MTDITTFTTQAAGRYSMTGPMVFGTVPGLNTRFIPELQQHREVVIDLGEVTRADSAGLALLLEWQGLVSARGGSVRFENLPSQLVALIRVSGLESAFPAIH